MFEPPRFRKTLKPKSPSNGRRDFGKVRNARGRGYFGQSEGKLKDASKKRAVLSTIVLALSVLFATSILGPMVGAGHGNASEGFFATATVSFVFFHLLFLFAEMGLGYELKYRGWAMGLVWGTIVAGMLIGICSAVLSR